MIDMYAIINGQRIPDNTLHFVILSLGGGVNIIGEVINEQERLEVNEILESLHQGDTVEFEVEDNDYHHFHGAGTISSINREEQGVGTLMRIKFSLAIQYVH